MLSPDAERPSLRDLFHILVSACDHTLSKCVLSRLAYTNSAVDRCRNGDIVNLTHSFNNIDDTLHMQQNHRCYHVRTGSGVANIRRGFCTLLSKRDKLRDTCNRACQVYVGKNTVATQIMADAPLHQASRIGAVVPRCTTFLVFGGFLHICERRHAHAPASHDIVAVDHHAKPQDSTLKSGLLWCKKASK